jgi:hypothetical protein
MPIRLSVAHSYSITAVTPRLLGISLNLTLRVFY